jgi:DNA-binding beta-propeller fold protein YncE
MGRLLANIAAAALAAGSCSGSSDIVPGTGSPAGTDTGGPGATLASTTSVAPGTAILSALPPLWKSTGPAGANPSFQPLAVDPKTADVWAAVPFENLFWVFAPDGKYLMSWGTAGSGPGQLDLSDHLQNPDGFGAIAFAPDGRFYIGDVGNNRVEEFDPTRHFVKAWGSFGSGDGQFAQITAVATDGKTVYVGDGVRGDIQAFDSDGTYLRTFADVGGGFGAFIAVDQAGNIYATNPSQSAPAVAKFDLMGNQIGRFDMSPIGDAVGLAVDSRGHIIVGAASRNAPYGPLGTYELGSDGHILRGWAFGGGGYLALSATGDTVYVSGWTWPYIEAYAIPKA